MSRADFRRSYAECRELLTQRLAEPAPGRIQLLAGPRQVGKTTLLLEIADQLREQAVYAAADAPEAALPGFWERGLARAEDVAAAEGRAVMLLDEAHLLHDWAARLKGVWDRCRRKKIPVHIVATGSPALHLAAGSRESLAGRFERITLTHWSAASIAEVFKVDRAKAADLVVRMGSYPGAFPLHEDVPRWSAYVRDAILEPAIGRDILALAAVRRPALLRQVFGVAASSPAQVVSLKKCATSATTAHRTSRSASWTVARGAAAATLDEVQATRRTAEGGASAHLDVTASRNRICTRTRPGIRSAARPGRNSSAPGRSRRRSARRRARRGRAPRCCRSILAGRARTPRTP